jgi:DNA end-binding protein Ku
MAKARSKRSPKPRGAAHARPASSTARALWSGSISFGLLQIPVTLHAAEQRAHEIHFRLLDKHDLSPIRNQRVNAGTGKPVEWKDIVKGYEYEPGTFVTLDDEDLKKANVAATQTIDIQDIVPLDDIDPQYFETPYYAVPSQRSGKAYMLLRDALRKKGASAIATFVLRSREHLCAIIPSGDALVVEVLRFGYELRAADELPLPQAPAGAKAGKTSPRELEMAERLIEEMMGKWEPSKYKDHFHDDVMQMIEHKAKTGKVRAVNTKAKGEVASNVIDLVSILRKSIDQKNRAGRAGPKKAAAA